MTEEKQENIVENTFQNPSNNGERRDNKGRFTDGNRFGKNGKPKGSVSITAEIKRKLDECPEGQKRTYLEILIIKILKKAVADEDSQMIKTIWNYIDGMPKQPIEGNLEGNFIIKWQNDNEDINDSLSKKPISEGDSSGQNPL